ncbi:surface lipoprotein assembly modifier [Desulfococcaceae bacterium HSG9]|nr:surface lipoprotein assembly modifier [Desulfococcaceae bacterium HSG9]
MNKSYALHLLIAFMIVISGVISGVAYGVEIDSAQTAKLEKAIKLMAEDNALEAYDLLWELVLEHPTDATLNTYLARAAFKLKLYENAAAAYERILISHPDRHPTRFQLAVAYYHLQALVLAEEQFLNLLDTQPPKEFKQAIDAYLERIQESRKKHRFNFDAQIGLTYDSNANIGPDKALIQTASGPITTPDGAEQEPNQAILIDLSGTHQFEISTSGDWAWQNSVRLNNSFYEESQFTLNMLSFSGGPLYGNDDMQIRLPVTADIIWYASDFYAQYYGITPVLIRKHTPSFFTNWMATAQIREYATDHDKDGSYFALSVSPRYFWHDDNYMAQVTLGYFFEDTESEIYTNKGLATSLGLFAVLTDKMSVYTEVGYQNPRYEQEDDYFGKIQEDEQYRGTVSLSYLLPWQNLAANISFEYTRNHSEIDYYDYTRRTTTFTLNKRF